MIPCQLDVWPFSPFCSWFQQSINLQPLKKGARLCFCLSIVLHVCFSGTFLHSYKSVFRQNKPLIRSKKKPKTLFDLIKIFQNTHIFKCINKVKAFTTFTTTLFTQRGTFCFCALKNRPTLVNILHHAGFSRCCINGGLIRFMWMWIQKSRCVFICVTYKI